MILKVPMSKLNMRKFKIKSDAFMEVELSDGRSFIFREVETNNRTSLEVSSMDLDDDQYVLLS